MGRLMIQFFRISFTLLFLVTVTAEVSVQAKHSHGLEEGDTALVSPDILFPTQFNLGLSEVNIREHTLESLKDKPTELVDYLKENTAKAVIGPKGKLYLIDGHHITRAVSDSGLKEVHVEIVKDYSDLKPKEFWAKLADKEWLYLYDNGVLRPQSELPKTIREMTDDPFRTLAWLVRKVGGYEKVKTPFAEFKWGDYFRKKMKKIDLSTPKSTQDALDRALKLASSASDQDLPGAIGDGPKGLGTGAGDECRKKYLELEARLFPLIPHKAGN